MVVPLTRNPSGCNSLSLRLLLSISFAVVSVFYLVLVLNRKRRSSTPDNFVSKHQCSYWTILLKVLTMTHAGEV
jgi:hypothetical protein